MASQQTLDLVTRADGGGLVGRYRVLVRLLTPGTVAHRARAVLRDVLLQAGADDESAGDAESAVAELAANAEAYACGPYELRVAFVDDRPVWCEVVDGDPDLNGIPGMLDRLRADGGDFDLDVFEEHGRGLLLVHLLSKGRCLAYPTRTCLSGVPGKAVAFALLPETSPRPCSPVPDVGLPEGAGARLPTPSRGHRPSLSQDPASLRESHL